MKKIFYLFAILLITSCSNNEETFDAVTSDFVGTWDLTSYTTESTTKTIYDGNTLTATSTSYAKDLDYTLTFTEDPNEYTSEGNYTIVLEYDLGFGFGVENEEYTVSSVDAFASGTWKIEDNKIIFVNPNGQSNAISIDADIDIEETGIDGITIKSISENKIVLEEVVSIDQKEDYFGEEILYEVDLKLSITLEK